MKSCFHRRIWRDFTSHVLIAPVIALIIVPACFTMVSGGNLPPDRQSSDRSGPREVLLLDTGWKFHLGSAADPALDFGFGTGTPFAKAGEAVGAVDIRFNDSGWTDVDLPHDWLVDLGFLRVDNEEVKSHGYKPVGRSFPETTIGWYRRTFLVPEADTGKRIAVRFDGVYRDCIVWINGHYLGNNLSGYSGFSFDITDYVLYGRKNVIVVRADASQYEGWFYEGAGIYRHVWLLKYAPVHIPEYGVVIRNDVTGVDDTVEAGGREVSAVVNIATDVVNESDRAVECKVISQILSPEGANAGGVTGEPVSVGAWEWKTVRQSITLPDPDLWSPDSPFLYTLASSVMMGGKKVDSLNTTFGIRTVRFDVDSGFYLNGRHLKIQGVCCHQDHAGVGSALPDRLQYFRIEKLKEMGVNAYRTSHNPPTRELLEACDSLGMLVLDENRLMGSAPEPAGQFRKLILRDRNHPSVILWSLGNEEWAIQNTDQGARIARSLLRVQRELDPTRLATYAANNGNHIEGINSVVPMRGFNYMNITDIDLYRKDHPDQLLIGTEEASTLCTRGIYTTDTVRGYLEDHDVNKPGWGSTAEQFWSFYATRPWLAGGFVWTGFDYRGEPTPYAWPCINSHFGIMDVCGFPKNNYYYYQAWWSDRPVLQISPHWNWKGRETDTITVWCNSNCERVELLLNGESLGEKTMPPYSHLEWKVPYRPGALEARGIRNGKEYRTVVETTGEPVDIHVVPDRRYISADGEDLCILTVTALDRDGREVPDASGKIEFSVEGPGKIIGVGNGDPSSHEPDRFSTGNWSRSLFNGKCQVILQAGRTPGNIILTAKNPSMKATGTTIVAKEAPLRPAVPPYEPVVVKHLGFGKPAEYAHPPASRYHGTGLLDGLLGTVDFRDGAWDGFEGVGLDLTVDLGEMTAIHTVTLGALSDNTSWIFLPSWVELYTSENGMGFRKVAARTFPPPERSEPAGVRRISLGPMEGEARYLRIVAHNIGTCPSWHRGAGDKAWLFVDEVVIE